MSDSEITGPVEMTEKKNKGSNKLVKRKPRNKGAVKDIKKFFKSVYGYSIPAVRYLLLPSLIFFSVNYTEPAPTVTELLNPFF